jgi:hypothetical protein
MWANIKASLIIFLVCNFTLYFLQDQKGKYKGWAQWFMPIIPATQEAEIGSLIVQGSPDKKLERPHFNKLSQA